MASFLYGGTFDEHAPVTAYVPEFVGTGWAGATIRQLLDQTTGVSINFQPSAWVKQQPPNVQAEWAWGSPAMRQADNELARQFRAAGRFPKLPHEPCDSGFFDYLRTVRQDHPHGSFFNYSAGNAGVLQVILERTTRASYFEHLTDFWRALGAERCATLMIDGAGCAAGQSGMACTLRDWARWGWMLCDGGRVGGGRTLPGIRELVADTQQHPESEKWTEKTGLKEGYPPGMGYRNHMFAFPSQSGRDPILSAQGAYHQNCVIDPLRKNVVVQVASFWKRGPGVNGEIALQSFMEETLPDLLKQGS
jgi:CubicO group peptidase (beta-lactamase class C family)